MLTALTEVLAGVEAYGQAACRVWICRLLKLTQNGEPRGVPGVVHMSDTVAIPADPLDIEALVQRFSRELARSAGFAEWG